MPQFIDTVEIPDGWTNFWNFIVLQGYPTVRPRTVNISIRNRHTTIDLLIKASIAEPTEEGGVHLINGQAKDFGFLYDV